MNVISINLALLSRFVATIIALFGILSFSIGQDCTYVVNTSDTNYDSDGCNDTHCSLVEALMEASTDNGPSIICFEDISAFTIELDNPLPVIQESNTIIDASNGNELGEVRIAPTNDYEDAVGLVIQNSDNVVIKGLTFTQFKTGIQVDNQSNDVVIGEGNRGNWFRECEVAIDVAGGPFGDSRINIMGNFIGTDTLGLFDYTDTSDLFAEGIRIGVRDAQIGGNGPGEENMFGYLERGIYYSHPDADDIRVDENIFVCNDIPIEANTPDNTSPPPVVVYATPEIIKGTGVPLADINVYLSGDVNCPDKPCQGRVHLGTVEVLFGTGEWELEISADQQLELGAFVTATMTIGGDNTSGFAFCKEVEWGCKGTTQAEDKAALLAFFQHHDGSNWDYSQSTFWREGFTFPVPNAGQAWDMSVPLGSWHGIELDYEGCVENLILNKVNLTDTLSSDIYQLAGLENLVITNNDALNGSIQPQIPNLKGLNYLDLSQNSLDGLVPEQISELTHLEILNLSNNQMKGVFPKISEVPLKTLRINKNEFTGILSLDSITSWSNVTVAGCRVDNNQLTFEDILPNMGVQQDLGTWMYPPQDSIYCAQSTVRY
jgi:hypothetical protein